MTRTVTDLIGRTSVPLACGVLLAMSCLGGCDKKQAQAAKVQEVKAQQTSNEAIARLRWPEFLEAFSKTADQASFKVKASIPLKTGGEADAWVQVSSVVGNNAAGPLLDAPAGSEHKKGDRVTVQPEKVKDWSYTLNGKRVGDFTAPPVPPAGEAPKK
jgi:uncharacterized protein YegJ (DUF2314 family)